MHFVEITLQPVRAIYFAKGDSKAGGPYCFSVSHSMTKTCVEQFLEEAKEEAFRKFYHFSEGFLHSVRAVIEEPDPAAYADAKWSLLQWMDGAKSLLEVHAARVGLLSLMNDIRLGKYKLVDTKTEEAKDIEFTSVSD